MTTASFGTISEGTLASDDLLCAFADALRDLATKAGNAEHLKLCDEADECDADSDDASDLICELEDALSEYAPPYGYFGTLEGDGACFGFWLSHESIRDAVQDGDLLKVDDLADVPTDYAGECLLVNDHGNCTLYAFDEGHSEAREIWSVV